jgi:antitoxin component HigA of HigAB toxin-antitoxin module/DNA-binding transcriptional regulator YiaG
MNLIKTDAEHGMAIARLSYLMDQDPPPGSELADELELLTLLTGHYEQRTVPPVKVTPIDMILFRMEQMQMKRKDLIPYIGSLSKVSEVLSGKRALSLPMIRRLHKGLHIAPEVLLQQALDASENSAPNDGAGADADEAEASHSWQAGASYSAPNPTYPSHSSTASLLQQERSVYQVTRVTEALGVPGLSDTSTPFDPQEVQAVRTRLDVSQAVLAHYLRTDAQSVAQWELGLQEPNPQAVLLMRLLRKFPDLAAHMALL